MAAQPLDSSPICKQISEFHATLRDDFPGVVRVAVALYDAAADRLRTFAHSTEGETPLAHYEVALADMPCLRELASTGRPRIIDDLTEGVDCEREHNRRILSQGYRSSFTVPFFEDGRLNGFLFFNAAERCYFSPEVARRLAVYASLASLLVLRGLAPVRVLRSAVRVTQEIGHIRDAETGAHLERMSRFSKTIATGIAESEGLTDEDVEFISLFAPLHDIGKIGIPDSILLKPGTLSRSELAVMRSHVSKGSSLVATLLRRFGLDDAPHVGRLRSIVRHHHECVDGSGYPDGLSGEAIPVDARIVATADVFDALTSERPYKPAWSNDTAFEFLETWAGRHLDARCVHALVENRDRVAAIQRRFREPRHDLGSHDGYSAEL